MVDIIPGILAWAGIIVIVVAGVSIVVKWAYDV